MEIPEQIAKIPKGKYSLAEALKQLEVVKKAFTKTEEIKEKLEKHDSEMTNIHFLITQMVPKNYFTSRIDDLASSIEKSILKKFDEFSSLYFSELSSKVSEKNLENFLNKRVTWAAFNNLSQQVSMMQTRLDKHLYSEYEGFKTKIKLELASKATDSKSFDTNNEEFLQMKNKLVTIEQKIEEMFMEDDNNDEDYDSQEEMDNIVDDIDAVARREDSNEAEIENEAEVEVEVEVQRGGEDASTTTGLVTNPSPFGSGLSLPEGVSIEPVQAAIEKKPEIKLEIEKPVSRNSRARTNSVGGESRARQRRNSKESSIAASRVLAGAAGVRQLNKKIIALQKDIENNHMDIEGNRDYIKNLEAELEKSKEYTNSLEEKIKNMVGTLEVMENSFIRALRRNGLEKKMNPTKETPVKVTLDEKITEKLEKKIEDKHKRILTLENEVEKMTHETFLMRKYFKDKINEIVKTVKTLDECRAAMNKEIHSALEKIEANHSFCVKSSENNGKKIEEIMGPLIDLVSDQQRENQILSEDSKRQQEIFRSLADKITSQKPKLTHRGHDYFIEEVKTVENTVRGKCLTPDISIKSKFNKTNISFKDSTVKSNVVFIGNMQDGNAISLPRVQNIKKIHSYSIN